MFEKRSSMKALLLLFALSTTQIFSQGFICAIGGGSENYNDWSDEPYSWIVQKADSGKVIIIDVTDNDSWLPNYFMSLGADTAYNKTIASRTIANLQSTYDELISANAIFIRGGDQWDYIRTWKETLVDSAIQFVFSKGGVIAGTSAGAALLGDIDFSAASGTIYPDDAIRYPFNSRMKFESNFLPLQKNVLFDTHFIERGRLTRLVAMIYNLSFSLNRDFIGVGIDDRTAICISPNGIGEVLGSGAVTILQKDERTKFSEYSSEDLYTIENLKADLITKNWRYDFLNNQINFIPSSAKNIDYSLSQLNPLTNFILTGNDNLADQSENIDYFLTQTGKENVLFITHSGFLKSDEMISYFQNHQVGYSVLNLSAANLNNAYEASKISNAESFIIWGDSLEVLSLLNQKGTLVANEFYSAAEKRKKFLFIGNAGKTAGEFYIDNTDKDYLASYRGKMTLNVGTNLFSNLIYQPRVFEADDFFENRISSVFWGLMRNRKPLGILADKNNRVEFSFDKNSIKTKSTIPSIIIDCRETTKVDSSVYRAKNSTGSRQVVAMNNVRISLTKYEQISYLIEEQKYDFLTTLNFEQDARNFPTEYFLYQNYPNPFNPSTKIRFVIPNEVRNLKNTRSKEYYSVLQFVTLKVYDVLGREIATLVNEQKPAGNYEVTFNASDLSSGIYLYKLSSGSFTQTKKMLLLR